MSPLKRRSAVLLCLVLPGLVAGTPVHAAEAPADSIVRALARYGLENLGAASDSVLRVGFENRRYRHSAQALGWIARTTRLRLVAIERRAALPAARLEPYEEAGPQHLRLEYDGSNAALASATLATIEQPLQSRFHVRYPCDPGFGTTPSITASPTSHKVDLLVGPVFSYELGRLITPFLYRLDLETMARWNPWPGGIAKASALFPVHNDFDFDPLHPDDDQVRPGQLTLEQYAWVPRVALASLSTGYFGDNRYGASFGLARPVAEGRLLIDAQADITGYLAFIDGGEYSTPRRWTGFLGASWRPGLDLGLRLRQGWYLSGDHGPELEVARAIGDFDVAAFAQRTNGDNVVGLRLAIPVPPFTRPTRGNVHVLPVERFHVDYRTRSEPLGHYVTGVGSRQEFLRQLDAPALDSNADRYRRARGDAPPLPRPVPPPPVLTSLTGTTGFINTPWAGVMTDRGLEVGVNRIPRHWAYDQRGLHDNVVYYATLGFLPRIEASARWTVIPGLRSFENIVPESRLTDTDYMASGRLVVFEPGPKRPGVAIGVDDLKGTRRFHATYAVAGIPWLIQGVQGRLAVGYAFRTFKAARRTLDGAFGAVEVSPWRGVAGQLEYDTEKWNLAVAVPVAHGVRLRAALLNVESLGVGAGFYLPLR